MEASKILKTLIDILFFLLAAVLIGVILLQLFLNFDDKAIAINGELMLWNDVGIKYWFIFTLGILISFLYLASIYYLRKAVKEMVEGQIFNVAVSEHLRRSGKILVSLSILSIILFFLKRLSENQISIGFEGSLSNSNLFMIIIGLFFMLTSEVINKGIQIKSENDLTI